MGIKIKLFQRFKTLSHAAGDQPGPLLLRRSGKGDALGRHCQVQESQRQRESHDEGPHKDAGRGSALQETGLWQHLCLQSDSIPGAITLKIHINWCKSSKRYNPSLLHSTEHNPSLTYSSKCRFRIRGPRRSLIRLVTRLISVFKVLRVFSRVPRSSV